MEPTPEKLKQLTNDELIDFALEHLGEENEYVRQLAMMEHYERTKDEPNTITDLPGEDKGLRLKLAQLMEKQNNK